jgi:hypothetical protein
VEAIVALVALVLALVVGTRDSLATKAEEAEAARVRSAVYGRSAPRT